MHYSKLILTALAASTAIAHGPNDLLSPAEIQRRGGLAKRCADQVGSFNQRRMKRGIHKRWQGSGHNTTYEITTKRLTTKLSKTTLVFFLQKSPVAPMSGRVRKPCVRTQDMTEDPPGVPLSLDIGVLDMATCEPLPNLLSELNINDYDLGVTDLHTDDTTWLRGMWPTNENGVMEMKTVFPGFYTGRAIHIHVQVHTDWSVHENGTIIGSNTVSTGQIYFEEELEQQIMNLEPYASHTQINRTTNAADSVFSQDTEGGYNPSVSIVPADGKNVTKGMIGYITIGVDTTAIENF